MFKPETTSLPIYVEGKGFKNAPLNDGKIDIKVQATIKDFLLKRDHELEEFSPKRLSDEQQGKVNEIIGFLTGKASSTFKKESDASSSDFDFEESFVDSQSVESDSDDDDDFFKDF
jgi:hypothetical protein